MVGQIGRRIDESSPLVDARLPDGSRVNAIIPPLSLSGPLLTIRKFAQNRFAMSELIEIGTLSKDAAEFLENCIRAQLNILISGGTGSGKTTFLNALSAAIPDSDRIVTIEDAAELQLDQQHVLRLESRPKNIEGEGEITIRDLVRNALRMRPDRIIVGEVRGAEALDMLQAMNTGHEGSLSTVHANSPRDALNRLETMVLMAGYELPLRAIRSHVSSALDLVVQLDRLDDGSRRVVEISEVQRMEGEVITLQKLFEFKIDHFDAERRIVGRLHPTGLRPGFLGKFERHGIDAAAEPVRWNCERDLRRERAGARGPGQRGRRQMRPVRALLASARRGARSRRRVGSGLCRRARSPPSPVCRSRSADTSSSVPEAADLDAGSVDVRENGLRVTGVRVDPLASSGLRFGVVLALDASESMTGAPAAAALESARAFVSHRTEHAGGRHRRVQRRHLGAARASRGTAPRCGAPSRRSRRSRTAPGSTTL